jgi:hypothetical protein
MNLPNLARPHPARVIFQYQGASAKDLPKGLPVICQEPAKGQDQAVEVRTEPVCPVAAKNIRPRATGAASDGRPRGSGVRALAQASPSPRHSRGIAGRAIGRRRGPVYLGRSRCSAGSGIARDVPGIPRSPHQDGKCKQEGHDDSSKGCSPDRTFPILAIVHGDSPRHDNDAPSQGATIWTLDIKGLFGGLLDRALPTVRSQCVHGRQPTAFSSLSERCSRPMPAAPRPQDRRKKPNA